MHLGAALVLIGLVLAALAVFVGAPYPGRRAPVTYAAPLLAFAVALIAIGVLIGGTKIS